MKHIARRLILALSLMAGIAPAMAQAPAPVPALPDAERRTSYTISGSTCACNVNFALYGDGTDYASWVEVWVNGIRYNYNDPTNGWTITSPSGPIANLARPISNAVLTFSNTQTGTVQIVGARRPRRTSQFSENRGVAARDLNQVLTDIVAQSRETWDKINDVSGRAVMAPPGETLTILAAAASRKNLGACFDNAGNLSTCVSIPSSSFIAGTGIVFTGTGPTTVAIDPALLAIIGVAPVPLATPGTSITYNQTYANAYVQRSNAGAAMQDALPNSTTGVLTQGTQIRIKNDDQVAPYAIQVAPPGSVTGTISGTTFTAASGLTGTISAGNKLEGTGVAFGTYIVQQLTGPVGGIGTYQVSVSQTVSSASISFGTALDGSLYGYIPLGPSQSTLIYSDGSNYRSIGSPQRAKANIAGLSTFTGSIAGTTLTVASGLTGTIVAGQMVGGGSVINGTIVGAQLTGATGGVGTYTVSISQTQGSTTLAAGFPTTIYYGVSGGTDTNPGLLPSAPVGTLQGAVDTMTKRYDLSAGFYVIQACQTAASTCPAPSVPQTINAGFLLRGKPPGLGNAAGVNPFYHAILIRGDSVTPANYTISTSGTCAQAIQGSFFIDGFTLVCGGDGINAGSASVVGIGNIAYGAMGGNDIVSNSSNIHWDINDTKTGAASCHKLAFNGGVIQANSPGLNTAMTAAVWSAGNYCVQSNGLIADAGTTQSGTATGPKFAVGPYSGAFAIGTKGVDPNTLLIGSTSGTYDLTGPANDVAAPGTFSTLNATGATANTAAAFDSSKNIVSVTGAAAAAADADTFPVNQGAGQLKQTLTAIKAWIKGWLVINATFPLGAGTGSALVAGATNFAGVGAICASGSEANCNVPIAAPATIKNLYVTSPTAPGGSDTYTLTVRKNNADTTIVCAISAAAKTCNDTTHTASYAAGDTIDVKMVASATAASSTGITFGLTQTLTPP